MKKKTLLTFLYSIALLISTETFSANDVTEMTAADTNSSEDRIAERVERSRKYLEKMIRMRENAQQRAKDGESKDPTVDQQITELKTERKRLKNYADTAMVAVEKQFEQCALKATAAHRARCQIAVIEEAQENHQIQHEAFLAHLTQLGSVIEQRTHERDEANAIAEGNEITANEALRRESELRAQIDDEAYKLQHQNRIPAKPDRRLKHNQNDNNLVNTPQKQMPSRRAPSKPVSDIARLSNGQKKMNSDAWIRHWEDNHPTATNTLEESAQVRRCREGVLAIQGWKNLKPSDADSIDAMIGYLNMHAPHALKRKPLKIETDTTNVNTVCRTPAEVTQR